ncbi:uncharacterized protein LOC131163564 [Malania oleifera]|uniref:uncharacterized protein LOC131163564 n=1 Tax=Malania oleifera TaxID=397392 RepID=UPI0025AE7311|nr:uncharacterized protein LOC131163564 [Malania oleifera]
MSKFPFINSLLSMQKGLLKASATVAASPSSSSLSFTAQSLSKSRGFPLETALSTAQTLQFDERKLRNYESVVTVLKSHKFSDTQIAELIARRPSIFQLRAEENLRHKMQYLIENGFAGLLLPELVLANPNILSRSLSSQIKPSFEFLKSILGTNEKVVDAAKRASWLLTDSTGTMQKNIDVLIDEGVPISSISKLMMLQPRVILQSAERFISALQTIKKLGFDPTSSVFVNAFRVMVSISDSTWKKKVEMLKSLGFSEENVVCAFKRAPHLLSCSVEKIKRAMDFYANTMNLEPAVIMACPALLMYSIDKRIRPRYNLLKFLESKKLFKQDKQLAWAFLLTEDEFLKSYVTKHLDQVPDLMELYQGLFMTEV